MLDILRTATLVALFAACANDDAERIPLCRDVTCVGLACDEQALCTCLLPSGDHITCDGSDNSLQEIP